jgi:hypothetical protein
VLPDATDEPAEGGVWILYVPGPGIVYLGRTFESPELVFVRSLEVDA